MGEMAKRILIIDDDAEVRHLLSIRLRRAGFTVGEAADGGEGLAAVHQETWDLVLLDLAMPNVDGFDFLTEIRSVPSPPVVVITQFDEPESQERSIALGALQFVTKKHAFDKNFVETVVKWVQALPERA